MNENETLREQMWDLCYGLLTAEEVAALHKQIKSDPAAARLYAEVRLQSDLVASAAKVEDASVTLSVPDEGRKVQPAGKSHSGAGESPFKPAKADRTGKKSFAHSYRTANWLAALAATALLALVGYGLYAPTQFRASAPPNSIVATVYARQPLQSGLTHHLKVVARDSSGNPASTAFGYDVVYEGNTVLRDVARTDQFGEAQFSLPGSVMKPGAVLELQAQGDKVSEAKPESLAAQERSFKVSANSSPKVVVQLAAKPEPVAADVQFEQDSYQPGETVRFWVHTWQTFSNQPAAPSKEWKLVADNGRVIQPAIETWPEAGIAAGEVALPADAPTGSYQLVGVNQQGGTAEEVARVAVGTDGPKSGDLARRGVIARNSRYLQMLQRESLAEQSADKGDKAGEQRDLKLSMAKKGKAEIAMADAAPPAPAPTVVPPIPAPTEAPAGPPAAKGAAAPGGASPVAASPREKDKSPNGLAGAYFKANTGTERGEQSLQVQDAQQNGQDRSGGMKEAAESTDDALVVQIPAKFAHMNLWAVVTKDNIPVAREEYKGRTRNEAKGMKSLQNGAVTNSPEPAPAAEAAAILPEGVNENSVAAKSLAAGTQLNLPLPPEADGELGVTLYDQSTQPPTAVYRQFVRRASLRDLNIAVKPTGDSTTLQQEMRLTLTATDRNGDAVPHSHFSVLIVKAEAVDAEGGVPAQTFRYAADKLADGRGRMIAQSAAGGAPGGSGFGGGGGRGAPSKDGDAKEGKKDEAQKKESFEREDLDKEIKLKKAQKGSAKPGELAEKAPHPAPATAAPVGRGGVESFSGASGVPQDLAKQLMEEEKGVRDEPAHALDYSESSSANQPVVPQEVLLGSNDSLIQDAVRAEEVAAQAERASFQRMTGRIVLVVAAAALLLFGVLAMLHRPAQAKVWVPAMVVVAGSFGVGCFWLMNGNLPSQHVAGNTAFSPAPSAPAKVYTEDFKPMAPAAMDDSRTGAEPENANANIGGIGPTVLLPAGGPERPAEKLPANFGAPRGGSASAKTEPAPSPNEPASPKLRAEDEKKKLDGNRQSSDPGKAELAKDTAESKRSGGAGQKPLAMKSMQANSEREKQARAPSLLWQPNLPANEKGEAELSIPLPAEEGDYYLLVDVQGSNGIGTALVRVHVPPAAAPSVPAAPASPSKP